MKKTITSIFLVIIIACALFVPVYAAPVTLEESEIASNGSAAFDLSKLVKQETKITLENGDTAVIGIEPIGLDKRATYPNATGKWKIYYIMAFLNVEYYIDISSASQITAASDQWYITFGANVSDCGLSYTSKKASGWWNYDVLGQGVIGARLYVYAEMNGTTLNTYVK